MVIVEQMKSHLSSAACFHPMANQVLSGFHTSKASEQGPLPYCCLLTTVIPRPSASKHELQEKERLQSYGFVMFKCIPEKSGGTHSTVVAVALLRLNSCYVNFPTVGGSPPCDF